MARKPSSRAALDSKKRKALEAAGWRVGDAADFLEMSDEERQLLEARVELALAVRRQRKAGHLSQQQLAAKMKTSQPRVAKIERAAPDVTLDQIVRAFTAAGGRITVKAATSGAAKKSPGKITVAKKRVARAVRLNLLASE